MENNDQSRIVMKSSVKAALIITFNSEQQGTISLYILVSIKINLFHFYSFEAELSKVKAKLKGAFWELKSEEEQALKETYRRINKANKLNVETIVSTETLKDDYKKTPVRVISNIEYIGKN